MNLDRTNYSLNTAFIALALSAIFIIWLEQFTNIDLMIEDYYYDHQLKAFVWKNTWFAKELMHVYVKKLIMLVAGLLLLIVATDAVAPWRNMSSWLRVRLRFVSFAAITIPLLVTSIKHFSALHCPWDVTRYGGDSPFVRLFDPVPASMSAGQCFPAGHATTGLWLAAICVFWLPHNIKIARLVFFAGISFGLMMGWVQQMRGAHFLFHTLWSAWLASLVILLTLTFTRKHFSPQLLNKKAIKIT